MRTRHPLTPLALAILGSLHGSAAWAQAQQPLLLQSSPLLREQLPPQARDQLPTFVRGERISGQTDFDTVVEGGAELRKGDTVIRADRLEYDQPGDLAKARGSVHVNRAGNTFDGPELNLRVDAFEGFFTQPSYRFLRNDAHGQADRVDFIDPARMVVRNATYTTCQREDVAGWSPAWVMRADSIRIDQDAGEGVATGAVLRFKNVPVLGVPRLTFPVDEQRRSGFLPPTFGVDSVNGVDYRQPYYWNIAPNRDATLYPTLMSRRGVDMAGEFRYLEPEYRGELRANYMPGDRLRDRDRWGISWRHNGGLSPVPVLGGVGVALNINRVSDDNYWRDFSRSTTSLTQRLLASDGQFTWARGYWFTQARALKWQTLQDVTAPIVPPYDRLPQLLARYTRQDLPGGFVTGLEMDTTRFEAVRALTGQPNAQRSYALGRIERPWQAPGWFVIPRAQLHTTQYAFDAPLANGATAASRTLPILSVDSGLVFERDASWFGRDFLQTLEPRAFYVHTPYRDQSILPNYDSGLNDFNFATVFTENSFAGNDRIADNKLLTLGATTRLIIPETGAEAARFGVAQRLRFKDQLVVLPGQSPVSERLSDILFGTTLNWTPQWTLDSTVQYNPKTSRSERVTVGGRYNPTRYRVVSAAYRLQRGLSEQLDVGWQWPLNDLWGDRGRDLGPGRGLGGGRWFSVGRLNWSLKDKRLVDTLLGIEYDGCCWIGRIALERLQNSTNTSATRLLFQLEFVGFSRLGSSIIAPLRQNIPRYELLRDPSLPPPSRFSNYD